MNYWQKYSYHDYEEAYCHMQYALCKEIGIYLLSRLKDDRSKQLLKELENYNYRYDKQSESRILEDVKI